MWCNQQIVVGLRLVIDMDTLETFVLYKLPILSDVLLIHVIHPVHPHSLSFIVLATNRSANELLVVIIQFVSQSLSYCVFLFFPLRMHCCPLGFICSDCFYWNPRVHCIVVIDLLVNFWCFSPLRLIIASIARFHIPAIVLFPYSLLVLAHWSLAKVYSWVAIYLLFSFIDLSRRKDMFIKINHVLFMLSCQIIWHPYQY